MLITLTFNRITERKLKLTFLTIHISFSILSFKIQDNFMHILLFLKQIKMKNLFIYFILAKLRSISFYDFWFFMGFFFSQIQQKVNNGIFSVFYLFDNNLFCNYKKGQISKKWFNLQISKDYVFSILIDTLFSPFWD